MLPSYNQCWTAALVCCFGGLASRSPKGIHVSCVQIQFFLVWRAEEETRLAQNMTDLMASTLAWKARARECNSSCCCWRDASTLRRAKDCFSQACFCTATRCCSACCLAASYLCRCCLLLGSSCRQSSSISIAIHTREDVETRK